MDKKCILCGSAVKPLATFYDYPVFLGVLPEKLSGQQLLENDLDVFYCTVCLHIQNLTELPDELKNIWYEQDYYAAPYPSITGIGKEEIKQFYDFVKSHINGKGRVLEIGCFDGYLLSLFKKDGWSAHGCEPNEAASIARDKFNIKIINDYFYPAHYKNKKFDLIIIRNLLEHLVEPGRFVFEIKKVLKKNGHIAIEVPNGLNILADGEIGSFHHEHISYFSYHTLQYLTFNHNLTIMASAVDSRLLVLCTQENKPLPPEILFPDDFKMERVVVNYQNNIHETKAKLADLFDKYNRIAILGAGGHTTGLLSLLKPEHIQKIHAIYDNDCFKHGKMMSGFDLRVSSMDLITEKFDILIISSYQYQDILFDQVMEMKRFDFKIVVLYPEVEIING